jgi:tripartite-type tricarboxylate transporter receptor subunit TctC
MHPLFCLLAALAAATPGANLQAQAYPSKPIRMVIPFAAGGPSDISARNISSRMTELLGASIVIDNRGGASGFIGAEIVAKAPPDGYTLMLATASITSKEFTAFIRKDIDMWAGVAKAAGVKVDQ